MNRQTSRSQIANAAPVDLDVYLVRADVIAQGKREGYWAERDEARANLTDTVADIMSGQIENVRAVVRFNTATFSCEDVTKDIMRDVMSRLIQENGELTRAEREMCEQHLGCRMVATAEREASAYLQAAE